MISVLIRTLTDTAIDGDGDTGDTEPPEVMSQLKTVDNRNPDSFPTLWLVLLV